jgi:hypothetical protein
MITHNVPKHVTSNTDLEIVEGKLVYFCTIKKATHATVVIQTVFPSGDAITTLGLQLTIPM